MNPLLLPVIAAQGMWVRLRTEVLPPAGGPNIGTVSGDTDGAPLRLAVVGESTAAGCGADSHDEAFTGALAHELAERTRRPVDWEVVGLHGATSKRIRYRLLPRLGENLDIAVLLAGANDVLGRRTPGQWGEDLVAIIDDLSARAECVAVIGNPPFESFPSLPGALRRYLARCAEAIDQESQRVCAERSAVTWIDSTGIMQIEPDFFARDGFHPSAYGYQRWAKAVADAMTSRSLPGL